MDGTMTFPSLIENMLNNNITHKRPIVLLTNHNDDFSIEKYNFGNKNISYVKGDATNKDDLKRANIKDADIAIIISETNCQDSDARSILKILTIGKIM